MNLACPTWAEVSLKPKSYFIRDSKTNQAGDPLPGMVYWWQSDLAGYVDFTNDEAVQWWKVGMLRPYVDPEIIKVSI